MSFTLTFGQEGNCATAEVVWSVDGQTYRFRSDNNFVSWISTIFTVADVVAGGGGDLLVSSDENPPVQGGVGNLWAEYGVGASVVGNARGVGAVDLQQNRFLATQVASGITATICGGQGNTASGDYATVAGGHQNTALGDYATVGGGYNSTVSGDYATVGGGYSNQAIGSQSTIGGGVGNTTNLAISTVGGGENNDATAQGSVVGGGGGNTALGDYATVGGGGSNTASGDYATVAGGHQNTALGDYATVGGGYSNNASVAYATVGGGRTNSASGVYATVGGGYSNTASNDCATVAGGFQNNALGYYATVGGGRTNSASGVYATVGGGYDALADRYGMVAHASGKFSSQGDAQAVEFVARNTTVNATSSVLFLDGSTASFTVTNNSLLSGVLTISGFNSTGTKNAVYQRSVLITNVGGTTTLPHISTISTDHETDATWNVTITADNATDSLNISCLGSAGDTVRWVAVFRGLEIVMP